MYLWIVVLLLTGATGETESISACSAGNSAGEKIEIATNVYKSEASASKWDNLWGTGDSMSGKISKMFDVAFKKDQRPDCPDGCSATEDKIVSLSIIPRKINKDYKNFDYCAKKLSDTTQSPILFSDKSFQTQKELENWFGEFSQGKGKDGEDLYRRCDRDCSPSYTVVVNTLADGSYTADAAVTCGHARDKSDGVYKLSADQVTTCQVTEEVTSK